MSLLGHHDFDYSILDQTAHRPWPMPSAPWIMTQTWHDLLFAHWPVGARELQAALPSSIDLDLFEGQAWLGIVPFHMTNVAPRLVPAIPWVSEFSELNVRTYVHVRGRPGVYFFSLDASNPLAVVAARTLFHLPYYAASMTIDRQAETIRYESRRTSDTAPEAILLARYRPTSPAHEAQPGSLEYFLTERYCLFTVDRTSQPCSVDIHHPPWPLQAAEAAIEANTMAEAAGIRLPAVAPLLHFSRRQDMVAWPLTKLE
jgi:uncharacterized protein YqjF (DUF2071 family)